jgi:hypothetical protein
MLEMRAMRIMTASSRARVELRGVYSIMCSKPATCSVVCYLIIIITCLVLGDELTRELQWL